MTDPTAIIAVSTIWFESEQPDKDGEVVLASFHTNRPIFLTNEAFDTYWDTLTVPEWVIEKRAVLGNRLDGFEIEEYTPNFIIKGGVGDVPLEELQKFAEVLVVSLKEREQPAALALLDPNGIGLLVGGV